MGKRKTLKSIVCGTAAFLLPYLPMAAKTATPIGLSFLPVVTAGCGGGGGGSGSHSPTSLTEAQGDKIIADKLLKYEDDGDIDWHETNCPMDLYDIVLDEFVEVEVDAVFTYMSDDRVLIHKVKETNLDYMITLLNENAYEVIVIRNPCTATQLSDILEEAKGNGFIPGEYN